jgi:aspartyl-tRNA synthetase
MKTKYRTHNALDTASLEVGASVKLCGWVHKSRNLGGVIFIDLRDRSEIVQIVVDSTASPALHKKVTPIRSEWVIQVVGTIRKRENPNPNMQTGLIEVVAEDIIILNEALPPIFSVSEDPDADELTKLKYRYLDLRRPSSLRKFILRHKATTKIRNYLDQNGFLDVETPMLTKSTPEGARDYLVPSRIYKGSFYALPQSPQLFKQLLMMSGFERYYQIVKCFRDEDLRADRQPEFTQVDIESSFIEQADIMGLINGLVREVFELIDIKIPETINSITFDEAMSKYGSDKPDLRFGLEFVDVTEVCKDIDFNVFKTIANEGGMIKGFRVPGASDKISRKVVDNLAELVVQLGIKGVTSIHIKEDLSWQSSISKFFTAEKMSTINSEMQVEAGDTIIMIANLDVDTVHQALGQIRLSLADTLNLRSAEYSLLWVTDFPLFEKNSEGNLTSVHHPFTAPKPEDVHLLETEPLKVRANAYDVVLNGTELGGGSIRIHNWDMQKKIFEMLRLTEEEIDEKFGFFVEALRHGTPPHGGVALGLDRFIMLLCGADSIRDVIAFPKTANGGCPLTNAPSQVSPDQLKELGLSIS